jgi:hypothetical protein
VTVVAGSLAPLPLAPLLDLFRRAVAQIRAPGVEHPPGGGLITFEAFTLAVGTEGPAHAGAFVPREPEPFQVIEDRPIVVLTDPLGVRVGDSQHELPAVPAGVEPCV